MSYKWVVENVTVRRLSDGACIPNDPLNADWQDFEAWTAAGGVPEAADPPSQGVYETAVKSALDRHARTKGYDSILSAVSYVTSTNATFAAQAVKLRDWRDACWTYCYDQLAKVQAGQITQPTVEQLVAGLPAAPAL